MPVLFLLRGCKTFYNIFHAPFPTFWYNRSVMNSPFYKSLCRLPEWAWVVLLLGVALVLRLTNLDATSVWMDEVYSLMVANGHITPATLHPAILSASEYYRQHLAWHPLDWQALLNALKINVHMPLYYVLLNPWLGQFGNNAIGLRSFSALCSTLMLIPVYLLGRAMGGQKLGMTALIVTALVPFQIYFGQEGRMYALSLLWCALSALAFWKTLYAPKPLGWSLLYALSVTAGVGTHYMFLFYLTFHGVYALWWLAKTRDFKRFALFGFAALSLGALGAAWYPVYQIQQHGVNEEYHFAKGWSGWLRYLTAPVWQPLMMIAGANRLERLVYIPATILLSLGFLWKRRETPAEGMGFFRTTGFVLLWIVVPLLAQIGYDALKQTHTVVIDRYVLLISPAMALWFAMALEQVAQASRKPGLFRSAVYSLMLLLAIATVWSPSPFRDEHNKDKDMQAKMRFMTHQARSDDLVFTNGPWGASLLAAYYLNAQRPNQPMTYWINAHRGQTVPLPPTGLLTPYHRVWLFRNRANNERGLQDIKEYLQTQYAAHTQLQDWFIYWNPAFSVAPVAGSP